MRAPALTSAALLLSNTTGDVGVQNGMLKFFLAPPSGPPIPQLRRRPMGVDEAEEPPASAHGEHSLPKGISKELLRARLSKREKKGVALT